LQGFIGWEDWEDAPLRHTLRRQVGQHLGQADGVLVCDPSAFPKSGRESGGVARQWCGRLGTVDNGHVAIYLGYVSRTGHTLVDLRVSLPKAWTQAKARVDKAGVPTVHRGYRTRHQLALEMLATHGATLPHGWIAGDDEMGRPRGFVVDWRAGGAICCGPLEYDDTRSGDAATRVWGEGASPHASLAKRCGLEPDA
jgi:SRSO17 transposase